MSALPAPLDGELRDPTREELFTAPARALPDEIQQLPAEDTACTFCGVSYFVFAEVQALQNTVKQYKVVFKNFIQFMELERREARAMRLQAVELKDNYTHLVASCQDTVKQLAEQCEKHARSSREALGELETVRRELLETQDTCKELQAVSNQYEGHKTASMLTEQKLREEIQQLSNETENIKLLTEAQRVEFAGEQDKIRRQVRDLEATIAERQADWTTTESQMISDRDILQQKLLAANELLDTKTNNAEQLETQLIALREELNRALSASDAEHKASSQMNSEIIQLKHQLQNLEKNRAQLVSENGRLKDNHYKDEDEITKLRLRAENLQGQLAVSSSSTEKAKSDFSRELEKLRGDHTLELEHLQKNHVEAMKELKAGHDNDLECLKKETAERQSQREESTRLAILAMQERLQDAERRADEWKNRALQNANEREEARRASSRFESMVESMKSTLSSSERNKTSRVELEKQREAVDRAHQSLAQEHKQLQVENKALEKQLKTLRSQLERKEARSGEKNRREVSNNQDCHEYEKLVEQLRHTLKQKDREISLLQQTVHRECMERTSLLERIRGGKVLPEGCIPVASSANNEHSQISDSDGDTEHQDDGNEDQPRATFYEKLRRAGRKAKPRSK